MLLKLSSRAFVHFFDDVHHPLIPMQSKTIPLRSALLDPEVNNFVPSKTRTDLMKQIRYRNVPHSSYDVVCIFLGIINNLYLVWHLLFVLGLRWLRQHFWLQICKKVWSWWKRSTRPRGEKSMQNCFGWRIFQITCTRFIVSPTFKVFFLVWVVVIASDCFILLFLVLLERAILRILTRKMCKT